ncbi:MAG: hypothetical protein IJ390_08745 [Lachnospiraceae bacterium]|nr:hypothetical protein [Lachnospiraceae bacterium]
MPFWNDKKKTTKHNPKNKILDGQNADPDSQTLLPSLNGEEKASCQALCGNMTVEAAIVLPLFLFAVINLISLILMFQEFSVQEGRLHQTGRELALLAHSQEDTGETDIRLVWTSQVKAVVPIAAFSSGFIVNGCVMHKWIGYDPGDCDGQEAGKAEEMVYITASGEAYHMRRSCIYLNPSIELTAKESAQKSQNSDGVLYTPCELCGGNSPMVYVTKAGVRYHSTVSCSGLKRSVDCVTLQEALGLGRHACAGCS